MNDVKQKVSVMLVDDHPMVQDGLRACLSFYEDIEVVGSTSNGEDALIEAVKLEPNVILMDISMPTMNGIDATEIITKRFNKYE